MINKVRLACSRQSTNLAWLAGTGAQVGASDTYTPAIHGQQALSVRSDQEKSKYERYTKSITMVYPWDLLTKFSISESLSLDFEMCLFRFEEPTNDFF